MIMQARGQRWQDVRLAAPRGCSLDWVVVLTGLKMYPREIFEQVVERISGTQNPISKSPSSATVWPTCRLNSNASLSANLPSSRKMSRA